MSSRTAGGHLDVVQGNRQQFIPVAPVRVDFIALEVVMDDADVDLLAQLPFGEAERTQLFSTAASRLMLLRSQVVRER